MLMKLMKYDFRSSKNEFLAINIGIVVVTLVTSLLNFTSSTVVATISGLIIFALIIAGIVIGFMTIINLYNKKVLGNEGYLTMMLPAKAWEITASKLLTSTIWVVITITVAIFVSTMSFYMQMRSLGPATAFFFPSNPIADVFSGMANNFGFTLLAIVTSILELMGVIITIYLSCTIAHLPIFKRYRILPAVLTFICIQLAESSIVSGINTVLPKTNVINENYMRINAMNGNFAAIANDIMAFIEPAVFMSMIVTTILLVFKFLLNVYLLDKKLEL